MRNLLAGVFVAFFSVSGFAADITPYFEALKQSGVNYEPDGAVCEQVARVDLRKEFPEADYIITTGIEYDIGGDTLGELDVVVINRSSQKVVMVAEVKCWRNLYNAMDKLKAQRDRFLWNLRQFPHKMRFESHEGLNVSVNQFSDVTTFRSIAQIGAGRRGFDVELAFTLSELGELRMQLLKCQSWGECKRP